ncbi:MAG: glucose-6-phosphate isomerase, partial [Gammaproteobacteria bacterium]
HMRDLFAADPKRQEQFSLEACGLHLDYSKNRITTETMEGLLRLAMAADVDAWIERMFAGEHINATEDRAVLHVALRHPVDEAFPSPANNVMPEVGSVLQHMEKFSEAVRNGEWKGFSGEPIRTVINIGIGGSDLGPAMVTEALAGYRHERIRTAFVSNLDSTQLAHALADADPRSTLFIVASKTFSTQETLTNARSARAWLVQAAGGDETAVAKHFVAVSTHRERTAAFGIAPENVFEFWDWVGGRYSVWSAIGLSVAVTVGMGSFRAFLSGGHAMDRHFRSSPFNRNMPVLMALLGIWYRNFFATATHAILPYDYALRRFPDYLQQLEMESNGKRVTQDGEILSHTTSPIIWGAPGNNGQHAFYQLLHQGTQLVPSDFIVSVHSQSPMPGHETAVLANALAQTEALLRGRTEEEARTILGEAGLSAAELEAAVLHRVMPGNQPSNTLLYEQLTPEIVGALVALYEHKVFVQGVIWEINSFDQWGVELGKQLAQSIQSDLEGEEPGAGHDASTNGLIRRVRKMREKGRE